MGTIAEKASITTPIGLRLDERALSFNEWRELGTRLGQLASASTWALADWVLYGAQTFPKGERYKQALEVTGFSYDHLVDLASIARRFPLERRRRELTFEHHRAVRGLPAQEQDILLERAEELDWSARRLREAIRSAARRELRRTGAKGNQEVPPSARDTSPKSAPSGPSAKVPALMEWPSEIRGPMRDDQARLVAEITGIEEFGEAYRWAAYVAESELNDGRGGEPLYEAAEAFCDALEAVASAVASRG